MEDLGGAWVRKKNPNETNLCRGRAATLPGAACLMLRLPSPLLSSPVGSARVSSALQSRSGGLESIGEEEGGVVGWGNGKEAGGERSHAMPSRHVPPPSLPPVHDTPTPLAFQSLPSLPARLNPTTSRSVPFGGPSPAQSYGEGP
jgi:hypothetical protein